jgi:hypothetical protein
VNDLIYNLINALRAELKQYGGMLATLEQHHDFVDRPEHGDLVLNVANINAQVDAITAAREEREYCLSEMAQGLGLEPSAGFADVIPLLPRNYRPLMEALEQENNHLAIRTHYRIRHNHLLLNNAAEMMRHLIKAIFPGDDLQTPEQWDIMVNGQNPDRINLPALPPLTPSLSLTR